MESITRGHVFIFCYRVRLVGGSGRSERNNLMYIISPHIIGGTVLTFVFQFIKRTLN